MFDALLPGSHIVRPLQIALISLGVVVAFYVLREHWGHVLGLAPYLLLLACPLLHLLHGGHGHHGHEPDQKHDH